MGAFVLEILRITHLDYKFTTGLNDKVKPTDSTKKWESNQQNTVEFPQQQPTSAHQQNTLSETAPMYSVSQCKAENTALLSARTMFQTLASLLLGNQVVWFYV